MQSGLQHRAQCKLRRVSPTLSRVGSPRGRRIDRQDFERARRSSGGNAGEIPGKRIPLNEAVMTEKRDVSNIVIIILRNANAILC